MDKLKAFRKRHNLTQADIYIALGYKRRIWEKYERGERDIPQHVFISMDNYTKLNKKNHQKKDAWDKLNNMLIEAKNSGISNRTIEEIGDAVLKSKGLKR